MPVFGIRLVDANVWLALAFSDHVHHQISASYLAAFAFSARLPLSTLDRDFQQFGGLTLDLVGQA